MSQILLQHFIGKSINITVGKKLEEINLGSPVTGLLFVFFSLTLLWNLNFLMAFKIPSWNVVQVSFSCIGH